MVEVKMKAEEKAFLDGLKSNYQNDRIDDFEAMYQNVTKGQQIVIGAE